MSTLMEELTAIKAVEDKITANKVANFAYTDTAYNDPANYADGVANYDPDAEQNVPVGNPSTLKVNTTILTKGWRSQASAITRMLMNHFLGRTSYNLNKVNDLFSLLLTKLMTFMGQPDGLATLNSTGKVVATQLYAIGSSNLSVTRSFLGAVFGNLLAHIWLQGSTATSLTFNCVHYAKGLWVGGSVSNGLWWSEDGKVWTQVTGTSISSTFSAILYAEGLWVAVTNMSDNNGIYRSTDGKNWYKGGGTYATDKYLCLAYGNGVWIAGGSSLYKSTDGVNWSVSDTHYAYAVVYARGLWVYASTTRLYWSDDDGVNWNDVTITTGNNCLCLGYANGLWVTGRGSGGDGLYWSTDGKSWTKGSGGGSYTFNAVYGANGMWVACSDSHGLWWSTDGKTWTQSSEASSYTFNSVFYLNGIWVACSASHGLWWSTDGKVWFQCNGATSYTVKATFCGNGAWVAGTDSHGLWYSSIDDLIADGTIDLGADIPLVNS